MTREEAITALKAASDTYEAAYEASAEAHRIYDGLEVAVCDTAEEVAYAVAYGGYDMVILAADAASEADKAAHRANTRAAFDAVMREWERIGLEYPLLSELLNDLQRGR